MQKKGQSQKSFGSPLEVLWKSSPVVASVMDTQTDKQTSIWTSRAAVTTKKQLQNND